jgi:hypothetical protein
MRRDPHYLPAGKTAAVTVISATGHDGPDRIYTGAVTAKASGITLTTPIVVNKEVESHNLTISYVGRDGKPSGAIRTRCGGIDTRLRKRSLLRAPPSN